MNLSTRHPDVQILPNSHVPVSVSSLTAKSIERGARVVNATGHNGLYIVRASGLARTYVAQSWDTGFSFTFKSVETLRHWLSKKD